MRVLFLCTDSPFPPTSGAALRSWGWMRAIRDRCAVGLVCLTRDPGEPARLAANFDFGGPLRTVAAARTPWRRARDGARAILRRQPYLLTAAVEAEMAAGVGKILRQWRPDLVQAELLPATQYLDVARSVGIPTIYSAHNVESRLVRDAGGLCGRLRIARMERAETRARTAASAVVAVSDAEAGIARVDARRVVSIPNAVHCQDYPYREAADRDAEMVFFAGHLRYPPNADAARILARRILPRLRRRRPRVRCVVAGRSPRRAIRRLRVAGLELVADAPDLAPWWRRAGVFLCPLRRGAGSRLKLLEAAAWGVPIVATPFSLEGLALEPGRDCLTAESPEELAEQAERVLADRRRADTLARRARRTVERAHDWPRLAGSIEELYEDLTGHHGQG